MVFPVHLQRSAVAAILDCPVWRQYTGPETLKPVALQLIWLFQEPLLTATNSSRSGAQQREVQTLSAAELRLVQLIPFGEVITRFPLPLLLTATSSPS